MLYFTIQNRLQAGTSKVSEAAGARWRFYPRIILGCVRIILGLSSDYPRIVFLLAEAFREYPLKSSASRFRDRRSIWWGWRVTSLAPRIGNEVSYVTQIIADIHFAWQAQYLVRLEGDFTCSTHWKWGFICDADQCWHSFCVAGAALRDILGDSRSAKCCILQYKIVSKMGRVRSPKRRVRDDDFILGLSSDVFGLSSDYPRIILESSFYWRKHSGSIRWNLQLQDFVTGAVFGEVGGWLHLLHALEMRFHMWRRSSMTFILRGRRSIWWGWRVTLLAPRIENEVSYVTQISADIHFVWQAQHFVTFWEIAGARNVVFYNTKSSPRWEE